MLASMIAWILFRFLRMPSEYFSSQEKHSSYHLGGDMDIQEIKWEQYPRTAAHPATRSFVERLVLKGKQPKTVDAYARAIEDLLTYFTQIDPSCILEADEADLDRYIAY